MSKLLTHLPALCNVVRRVAIEAGNITLDYFEEGMIQTPRTKNDGSPVTDADRLAEDYIIRELRDTIASIPVIGEESCAAGDLPDIAGEEYFWLVDPLDGTREFIQGSPDFTVNIALIKQGAPILGVIYAPAHGDMYSAYGEGTAVRWNEQTGNEKAIRVRRQTHAGLTVVASKTRSQQELEVFLAEYKVEKIIRKGSSLKICAIACGKADLYPGLSQTCEWDTAAGQAILEAAGGEIVSAEGADPLRYGNSAGGFKNPQFIAQAK